jgi:hypothetical protein
MNQYSNYHPSSPSADDKTGFQKSAPETYSRSVELDAYPGDFEARQLAKEQTKMAVFTAISLVILIFNIAVLCTYARRVGSPGPIIPVFRGSCTKVARFNLWIHLLINILAVGLAMASANGMRNLRLARESPLHDRQLHGSGGSILFFFVASLLPICVLYNAAVYQAAVGNAFYATAIGPDFFSAGPAAPPAALSGANFSGFDAAYRDMRANGSSWVRLDNLQCIATYSAVFLRDYRNLILVVANASRPAELYQAFYVDWRDFIGLSPEPGVGNDVYTWMCPPDSWTGSSYCVNSTCYAVAPQHCTLPDLKRNATLWTAPLSKLASFYTPDLRPAPIEYCLAEPSTSCAPSD